MEILDELIGEKKMSHTKWPSLLLANIPNIGITYTYTIRRIGIFQIDNLL